jgi:hypothetical protein
VSLFEVDLQKPRNLRVHESEVCDSGEGVGVYGILLQSDTLAIWSLKNSHNPWGVGLSKNPKDLSGSEREEREYGEGGDV